jgi:hypothetical protein
MGFYEVTLPAQNHLRHRDVNDVFHRLAFGNQLNDFAGPGAGSFGFFPMKSP